MERDRLGEDEQKAPEAFEHFGITTVEAMASGCVPVSFARAGQPEIIQHGTSGFLWNSFRECQAFTRQLMEDSVLRERTARAALVRSQSFGASAFEDALVRSMDRLVEQHVDANRLPPERLASRRRPACEERLTDSIDLGFTEIRTRR